MILCYIEEFEGPPTPMYSPLFLITTCWDTAAVIISILAKKLQL